MDSDSEPDHAPWVPTSASPDGVQDAPGGGQQIEQLARWALEADPSHPSAATFQNLPQSLAHGRCMDGFGWMDGPRQVGFLIYNLKVTRCGQDSVRESGYRVYLCPSRPIRSVYSTLAVAVIILGKRGEGEENIKELKRTKRLAVRGSWLYENRTLRVRFGSSV